MTVFPRSPGRMPSASSPRRSRRPFALVPAVLVAVGAFASGTLGAETKAIGGEPDEGRDGGGVADEESVAGATSRGVRDRLTRRRAIGPRTRKRSIRSGKNVAARARTVTARRSEPRRTDPREGTCKHARPNVSPRHAGRTRDANPSPTAVPHPCPLPAPSPARSRHSSPPPRWVPARPSTPIAAPSSTPVTASRKRVPACRFPGAPRSPSSPNAGSRSRRDGSPLRRLPRLLRRRLPAQAHLARRHRAGARAARASTRSASPPIGRRGCTSTSPTSRAGVRAASTPP